MTTQNQPDLQIELNGLRASIEDLISHAENIQAIANNMIVDVEAVIKKWHEFADKAEYWAENKSHANGFRHCADSLEKLVNKWRKQ